MSKTKVYILGGAQTDFSLRWEREGKGIDDLMASSFEQALEQVQLETSDIESIHVGNFVGELFSGQGQLGGLLVQYFPELAGVPSARHEAACASGSMAAFAAMREIEAGWYDLVAVTGVELMRNVDGKTASAYLGAAAWKGHEAEEANYPWVYLFSEIRDYYQDRFGVEAAHLAAIAKNNYANARRNPAAQTRQWSLSEGDFGNDELQNPVVEGSLRKSDCARITDGSATLFLASEEYAQRYAAQRNIPLAHLPFIKGWGHRTAPIALKHKLENAPTGAYPFPHLHGAIQDALQRANLSNATELDAIETHDCFTISEYVALEHFGLAEAGKAWQLIENESIAFAGSLPVNPSGGLIGAGHPVGATGVRMLLDAYKQVSGKAGDYQIANANNVGILNIGGSFTTVASFVVSK
ncbi:MAG: thiolase domain-containing protein [Saprospiraceae bacterium]|nr:thiolase domain-containing protein [Saprospiraceae bacterium]